MIRVSGGVWAAALLCTLAIATPAAGQQVSDSARTQVLERLRALARPPGLDSTLLIDDSVAQARLQAQRTPAAASGPDSVASALLGLPGFSITRYEGTGAHFDATTRSLTLRGGDGARAKVSQDGFEMVADSAIYYDEQGGRVRSQGAAEFVQPGGEPVSASTLLYDLNQDRGTALGARTTYSEGVNWRVSGDLTSVTPEESWGLHATLTSCELDEPHYHFRTGEVKFVNDDWFVARNVTLRFADVPVMWLPFIAQGLGGGRSSGLLAPRFSINDVLRTSSGYSRRISNLGFYWAMSDYSDLTLAMDWFSDRFFSVSGSTGFVWAKQFLRGNLDWREYWPTEGGGQRAFNGNLDWEMNERTALRVSAAYTSSEDFVRQNSFDPRELTQTINSQGGINRRFDWGSLNLGANRQQHLSNDKVTMTLPSASLSLSPITFFRASGSGASWYNNTTWSGGVQYSRDITDFAQMVGDTITESTADQGRTRASLQSGFTMGGLSFTQSFALNESATLDLPLAALPYDTLGPIPEGVRDLRESNVDWSATIDYQQNLIGSLTLTPRLSFGGNLLRSDRIPEATDYVAGPNKMTFGATAKADFYGFFPGFGNFSQLRHKIATQIGYDWSPEVTPTELQQSVFSNSRAVQATNRMQISLNNTIEAKVRPPDYTAQAQAAADSAVAAANAGPLQPAGQQQEGPRRRDQQERVITLLGLNTSTVQYDFVAAEEGGRWKDGLETTRLTTQVTSDYLRGLSLSSEFDLFDPATTTGGEFGAGTKRRWAPHVSRLNLGFALGANSTVFRWLNRIAGGTGEVREATQDEEDVVDEDDPLGNASDVDEASIVPRADDPFSTVRGDRGGARRGGGWSANFNYTLNRPRGEGLEGTQQLNANVRFEPTQLWSVSWRTSYDFNESQFLDHSVRLSRDLHRWEANFDFRQTLAGNWSFRFEVALKDNRDLKFDYEQRSLETGLLGIPR